MSKVINIWIYGDVSVTPPNNPGVPWGGDVVLNNDGRSVTVYSWEKDSNVTFSAINQTIVVDPRDYTEDTAGANQAADDFCAEATALQGAGFKAGFRYWKEDALGLTGNILRGNWWETIEPYEAIPVDATMQSWWDDFNARVTANAVTPDYKMHDFEEGVGYFQLPDEATRQTFFESITIDSPSNPYPNSPNPYIGSQIWKYSDPLTDQFLQEYNQDAAELRTTFLKTISETCPVADTQYSNYNDYLQSYEIGNLRGLPNRLPAEQTRLASISAPVMYLDYRDTETLTDPEPAYSSARQQINRRRWKKLIWRHNKVKSAASAGSAVHPWIAPPGYAASGPDSWALSDDVVMPFEYLLWRVKMRHLLALGLDTFILWNPSSNNPNSEDTDNFMDDYFSNLPVYNIDTKVGPTPMTSNSIVTNGKVTNYDDVYRIRILNYQTTASPIIPFSQGFGTEEEPLIVNAATASAEITAFENALAAVYGSDPLDPDAYQVPITAERSGFIPGPS